MAHHLAPIQPLWSFIAPAARVRDPAFGEAAAPLRADAVQAWRRALRADAVQAWRRGADGRPQLRWAVRLKTPG